MNHNKYDMLKDRNDVYNIKEEIKQVLAFYEKKHLSVTDLIQEQKFLVMFLNKRYGKRFKNK